MAPEYLFILRRPNKSNWNESDEIFVCFSVFCGVANLFLFVLWRHFQYNIIINGNKIEKEWRRIANENCEIIKIVVEFSWNMIKNIYFLLAFFFHSFWCRLFASDIFVEWIYRTMINIFDHGICVRLKLLLVMWKIVMLENEAELITEYLSAGMK